MREILFRGKAEGCKVWLYGDLRHWSEKRKGIYDYAWGRTYDVDASTVGQFTGLIDGKGKKIFDGDIVRHYNGSEDLFDTGRVYWDADFCGWRRTTDNVFHPGVPGSYRMSASCDYEVIGNIHDNCWEEFRWQ